MAGKGGSSPTDAARAVRQLPAFVSPPASGTILAMCAEVNVHESRNYVSPQTLLIFNPHPHLSTERESESELYFSTVKILAQRSTFISAIATVLLITTTFTHTHRGGGGRERETDRQTHRQIDTETDRQTQTDRERHTYKRAETETKTTRLSEVCVHISQLCFWFGVWINRSS